jgi:MYXO-CTERM domain-containing protein
MVSSILKRPSGLGIAVGLALALVASAAEAHKNGIAAQGCTGCHNGGAPPTAVTITSSASPISPGQTVMLSVNITTPEGWAGLFLQADVGTLTSLAGQGTQILSGGITHTAPKKAVNGVATFVVGWTAPAAPGGVNLNVYALAANGDGSSRGDGAGTGFESFAFGCGTGTLYIRDFDGDTWGAMSSGYTRNCSLPKYYATRDGDCNDSDERIYPGAMEVCNKRDDNCNGMIDEGLPILTCHVDMDGDGHGSPNGPTVSNDCICPKGYAPSADDCDDTDPTVYGGAPELCDYKDNNCNGQKDEGARMRCGTGWCARLGDSCSSTSCTPGAPRPEVCNDFDDDCDGVNDNGTAEQLCGAPGMLCVAGTCYPAGMVPPDAGAPSSGSGGSTGGGTGVAGSASGGLAGTGATVPDPGLTGAGGRDRVQAGCAVAGGRSGALVLALAGVALLLARRRRR